MGDVVIRSGAKVLTTHVGSLPHTTAWRDWIEMTGSAGDDSARETQIRAAVSELVAAQVAAGVDVVGDGEVSRAGFASHLDARLSGFGAVGEPPAPEDLADYPAYAEKLMARPTAGASLLPRTCVGPITYCGEALLQRDIDALRDGLAGHAVAEAFLTAPSPGTIAAFNQNRHYPSYEAFLGAIADAMRVEYRAIHAAGFLLQIDCADIAAARHIEFPDASVDEYRALVAMHIEALNHAVAAIPPSRMRLHFCWGNYEGPHHRDVPLGDILDLILKARPAGISFPAANPRHEHEWHVWERAHVPESKVLLPGVIDTTTNFIEHPQLVAERILRFTRLVGLNNVIASTDCGFRAWTGNSFVESTVAWGKLRALVEGAVLATAELAPVRPRRSRARSNNRAGDSRAQK